MLRLKRFRAEIKGKVQGVFYRVNAKKQATALGIKGFIRNLHNGSVELEAEGEDELLRDLLRWCEHGPPHAEVEHVTVEWLPPIGKYSSFEIVT